jgi:hypothetical protein
MTIIIPRKDTKDTGLGRTVFTFIKDAFAKLRIKD